MAKYRKKPVVIEAWQWDGTWFKFETTPGWLLAAQQHWPLPNGVRYRSACNEEDAAVDIATLEGIMTAQEGDWIIRGIKGELYPCKPDIFEATYEPVED